MKKEFITLEEFAELCEVKVSTIIKRYNEIPGIIKTKKEYKVLEGTRYPLSKKYKIHEYIDRYYLILKALSYSSPKFVDSKMLKLTKNEFDKIINNLLERKWIEKINVSNKFGTNPYIITLEGSTVLQGRKDESIKRIKEGLKNIVELAVLVYPLINK